LSWCSPRRPGRPSPDDHHALTGDCAPYQQEAPGQGSGRDRRPAGAARVRPHRHVA
jgi:hypothetical protein